jgi:hypothetical protein
MDLGMFKWGRIGFAAWLLGPPAFMAAVLIPCSVYCRQINRECDQRAALLKDIPEMAGLNARAREIVKCFPLRSSASGDSAVEASETIQRTAQQHGLTIRSLTTEKGESPGRSELTTVTVSIQGDGSLPAIIEMFDDLQRPERLCDADNVRLRLSRSSPDQAAYNMQIVFQCNAVSLAGRN